ncbi:MAG: Uma2 family endonuclease [Pseudomonadota bacterium]
MNVRPNIPTDHLLTVDEFLAMLAERPDWERWELIEGVAVVSPSAVDYHQIVVGNIIHILLTARAEIGATWLPMVGTNTRVPASPNSLPIPDVMVKERPPTGSNVADDGLVLFEVLSPSNDRADRAWRRKVFASVPNCQHFVMIDVKRCEVMAFDRANAWAETTLSNLDDLLQLRALGVSVALRDLYRFTPVADAG